MTAHDLHTRELLQQIEAGSVSSQRLLARDLGIALGLTNNLLRRTITRGWVRVVRLRPNRVRYCLTPAGLAEKARMSRDYLSNTVRFYREVREELQERFAVLSAELDAAAPKGTPASKRIAFFGIGEVAEIGFICLPATDLTLVAAVHSTPTSFFSVPIVSPDALTATHAGEVPYDRIVVMSFGESAAIREELRKAGVPARRTFWL